MRLATTMRRPTKTRSKTDDNIARRYCFKATVRMRSAPDGPPVGMFTAFGSTIEVMHQVEGACELFQNADQRPGLVCGAAEVTLFEECPVELTDEIFFTPLEM